MPDLGTLSHDTRAYIVRRAECSGIGLHRLGLDADPVPVRHDLHRIVVLVNGEPRESFHVHTLFEVNIADWVAERLDDTERTWAVEVYKYTRIGEGLVYRIADS